MLSKRSFRVIENGQTFPTSQENRVDIRLTSFTRPAKEINNLAD